MLRVEHLAPRAQLLQIRADIRVSDGAQKWQLPPQPVTQLDDWSQDGPAFSSLHSWVLGLFLQGSAKG